MCGRVRRRVPSRDGPGPQPASRQRPAKEQRCLGGGAELAIDQVGGLGDDKGARDKRSGVVLQQASAGEVAGVVTVRRGQERARATSSTQSPPKPSARSRQLARPHGPNRTRPPRRRPGAGADVAPPGLRQVALPTVRRRSHRAAQPGNSSRYMQRYATRGETLRGDDVASHLPPTRRRQVGR